MIWKKIMYFCNKLLSLFIVFISSSYSLEHFKIRSLLSCLLCIDTGQQRQRDHEVPLSLLAWPAISGVGFLPPQALFLALLCVCVWCSFLFAALGPWRSSHSWATYTCWQSYICRWCSRQRALFSRAVELQSTLHHWVTIVSWTLAHPKKWSCCVSLSEGN